MLKNEFYELDDLTSIVVSYNSQKPSWGRTDWHYQATVRYITTTSCLTVTIPETSDLEYLKIQAGTVVQEMKAEYEQHIRTS